MAVLAKRKSNPEGRMSLVDHLLEFRNRVVKSAIALFLGAIIGWVLFDFVYEHLTAPLVAVAKSRGQEGQLVTLNYGGLTAPFSQRINLSIWVGVIVASPVWLYQAWAYIVPALTPKERKLSYAFIGSTIPLFAAGCAFGFWTLPKAVKILLGFTPNGAANLPDAALYFQTVTRFILDNGSRGFVAGCLDAQDQHGPTTSFRALLLPAWKRRGAWWSLRPGQCRRGRRARRLSSLRRR